MPMPIAERQSGQNLNVHEGLTTCGEQPLEFVATKHFTLQQRQRQGIELPASRLQQLLALCERLSGSAGFWL